MSADSHGSVDRWVRSLAYDALCLRDRLSGWKLSRDSLLKSLALGREQIAKNTQAALGRLLQHAGQTSPYYKELWKTIGYSPAPMVKPEDIWNLPFLTKEILKENKNLLVSTRYQKSMLDLSYTGGTTGTQTSFYLDHGCKISRVGRQWGMLESCGYRPGMRRALVWGVHEDLLPQSMKGGLKQWFRRYATSQETLPCSVMSDSAMLEYHGRLLRFRPEILYGYPSALARFGRFIEEQGLDPIHVRRTITTAECLTGAVRNQLAGMFAGEVYNLYCTREHGCIGFECDRHQGFHIDTGSVYLEIIDNGQRVEPGETGEIVITDLLNYGMPFIRSRTGDLGALSTQPCECGSSLPVLTGLEGRSSDLIYRPDGSVVPGLMLTDLFVEIPEIRYQQFVQNNADELDVLLVVTKAFSDISRSEVIREIRQLVGAGMEIRVKLVDDIERNPRSGKIQEVISRIRQ